MRSDRTLKAWYRDINTRYFDSELPDNVCVCWADDGEADGMFGFADNCDDGRHKYVIMMNPELCRRVTIKLGTLIHEMVHIKLELRDDHGPAFAREIRILFDKGIFKKGAVYRGVTLF